MEVTFQGRNLKDAQEVIFYEPGITVKELKPVDAGSVKVKFTIAADASSATTRCRLRTATGMTDLRTFFVGPFPTIEEDEPNNEFAKPQPIPMNVTVSA